VSDEEARPGLVAFPSLDPLPLVDPPIDDRLPKLPFEASGPIPASTQGGRTHDLPDGQQLRYAPAPDIGIQLLDRAGKVVHHFEKGRVIASDVTPDGRLLVTNGHNADGSFHDPKLRFWDVATGVEVAAVPVNPPLDYYMRFSPDGTRLVTRHNTGVVWVWDVEKRKPVMALDSDGFWPEWLAYSKDGRFLVGGTTGSAVLVIWDLADPG
jgi:WD40 repeat protein